MDEPIPRRGGTWLVLLLAVAIAAGLGAAVVSIGGTAGNPFAQLGAPIGSTSSRSECLGCGERPSASAAGPAAPVAGTNARQGPTPGQGTRARSVATGGRAAAPPAASAPQQVVAAPAAAASSGGLCETIGRTGPPLLQTVLSPVAAVCDVLL